MYNRVRRRKVAEINVVPYIDVMLVLLIIFMVTAPLITQGVKVDLPQADAQPLSKDMKPPLVASVDANGNYYLAVGTSKNEPMSAEEVATLVAAHLKLAPDTPVVVNGDGAVSYDAVIQLMVMLQKIAGVPSVGLMTDTPESK
ncbi:MULTISPECIES: protein TolR [unclassified Colwellia]|jgi:biopolymer transport protein TolR|uniref:protein TolR n=1 Tax=unclassified Colwellia TaxID=196834 RepID=UPI0015F40AF2|nr:MULTISPECIES: protein TolR [unclassified Colwellia]MBA6223493.1 protein TolR [Colwellia sp. MB3u-45]MBA6269150.1 protein TolR [Colwellia sp. MB3u-43]MBA6289654.1 protein TolR [Colwellia sp. MB3u-4]MBA6291573.1 protein TolR [Colwellia sp. MB3u-8]MBA6295989.1 protein TolR [Colwellia sp. MB02u-9]